jgi:hypothetical protein
MVGSRALGVSVVGSACVFAVAVGGSIFRWPHSFNAPDALSCSPALRSLPIKEVASLAFTTDVCRVAIALQAGVLRGLSAFGFSDILSLPLDRTIARMLKRKADMLTNGDLGDLDDILLEVAPSIHQTALDIPGIVEQRVAKVEGQVVAVLVSPDHFVSCSLLERYGAALVAGMTVWQSYEESLSTVAPAPLPTSDTVLSRDDWTALDELVVVLVGLCEIASRLQFDVVIALGGNVVQGPGEFISGTEISHASSSVDVNRAIAVAHIATCLARSFSSPDPENRIFPSLILSVDTLRDMKAVGLLAEHTKVHLSFRLAPSHYEEDDMVSLDCAKPSPVLLAIPGMQQVPSHHVSVPAVFEYTPGIGDLQCARLKSALIYANRRGCSSLRTMVRRNFLGNESKLYASAARMPVSRAALRAESISLWTRVRMYVLQ